MRHKQQEGDIGFNAEILDSFPSIEDVLNISLYKFITFAANNYRYTGKTYDLIVNCVHTVFLNTKAAASKDYNESLW